MNTNTVPTIAPGNPHVEAAEQRLHAARVTAGPMTNGSLEAANQVAQAQVEATLAIVHEMRAANMIAIANSVPADLASSPVEWRQTIDSLLGLGDTK